MKFNIASCVVHQTRSYREYSINLWRGTGSYFLLDLFSVPLCMSPRQGVHPPIFLSPREALDSVKLAYHRHACVMCGCGSFWPIEECTLTTTNYRRCCYCHAILGTTAAVLLCCAVRALLQWCTCHSLHTSAYCMHSSIRCYVLLCSTWCYCCSAAVLCVHVVPH